MTATNVERFIQGMDINLSETDIKYTTVHRLEKERCQGDPAYDSSYHQELLEQVERYRIKGDAAIAELRKFYTGRPPSPKTLPQDRELYNKLSQNFTDKKALEKTLEAYEEQQHGHCPHYDGASHRNKLREFALLTHQPHEIVNEWITLAQEREEARRQIIIEEMKKAEETKARVKISYKVLKCGHVEMYANDELILLGQHSPDGRIYIQRTLDQRTLEESGFTHTVTNQKLCQCAKCQTDKIEEQKCGCLEKIGQRRCV